MQNNTDLRTKAMHLTKFEAVDALVSAWLKIEDLESKQIKEPEGGTTEPVKPPEAS